jgi:hypothetical protein
MSEKGTIIPSFMSRIMEMLDDSPAARQVGEVVKGPLLLAGGAKIAATAQNIPESSYFVNIDHGLSAAVPVIAQGRDTSQVMSRSLKG